MRNKEIIIRLSVMILVVALMFVNALPVLAATIDDLKYGVEKCLENKKIAHEMAECARKLGYSEDHVVIKTAQNRWWKEDALQKELESRIDIAKTETSLNESDTYVVPDEKKSEYPYAAQVWEYLKNELELNDYVAAGILGNMMSECGGQTLALQPFIYSGGYYGLCQWYIYYTPQVDGQDVAGQLEVLGATIQKNIEYFGGDYSYFCGLSNAYDAAWYFNKYYERGVWAAVRGTNAIKAYDYFCD